MSKHKKIKVPYDIVRAVNEFDKSFGIKLKHPSVWNEPKKYRAIYEARSEMNLGGVLCILNGLKPEDYQKYNENSIIPEVDGIMHVSFVDDSCLDWNSRKRYATSDFIFRCRFLTLVLANFNGNIHKIVENELIYTHNKIRHSKDELGIKITKDVINNCVRLVNLMVTNTTFANTILKINAYASFSKKPAKYIKYVNMVNGHILSLRNVAKPDIITNVGMDEDVVIYNILKIAYMLATGKTSIKNLPSFAELENIRFSYNLRKLIERLGVAIYKSKSVSPLFKAFIDASPKVYSQFHKNASRELRCGLTALEFASFVMNDKYISRCIDMMKRK